MSSFTVTDLGAAAIEAAVSRSGIPADLVNHVYMGQALQAGAGQSPAKRAAILSGLSETVDATTVNKVCASGLKAACLAAQEIMLGHGATVVAGGMESMSNVPLYKAKNRVSGGTKPAENDSFSDGLHDGLVNPYDGLFMGSCADQIAARYGISRNDQDKYAATAYRKACAAQKRGLHDHEITPIVSSSSSQPEDVVADTIRDKAVFQKLSSLPLAFSETGTITAGNSSTLADGAAAVVLANHTVAKKYCEKTEILARIISFADASERPLDFAVAPSKAIRLALQRAKLATDQVSLWEINEAFAVVVLVNQEVSSCGYCREVPGWLTITTLHLLLRFSNWTKAK